MPCSICGTWTMEPLWQKWDSAKARLHDKDYITCSRSWDGTYWFFFCDQCKANKGDKCKESEYSYPASDEESLTADEEGEDLLTQETAWTEPPWQKCFCTRGIMKKLVINLTAYTEIKLYRTCKHIYLGNQKKVKWWVNMDLMIQKVSGNN